MRRFFFVLILLFLVAGGSRRAGTAPAGAAPALPDPADGAATTLSTLLNADGTLNLSSGFQGTLDPAGWTMQTDGAGGAPRFVPAAPAVAGDENWDDRFGPGSGPSNYVDALAVSGGTLYVAGPFTTVGGVPANHIAAWDGTAWSALGSGMDGTDAVYALAVSGGTLYAGGYFGSAGGVPANHIAAWDGTAWSALGSGTNGFVLSLAVSGSTLYAGGTFSTAGGVPANCIAAWDGTAWSALGSGMGGNIVLALAVSGGTLYAGGNFTTAGGTAANYIAAWNGTAWSALGSGMNDAVNALAVSGGTLYAGGNFTTAGGTAANYIAAWNGTAWSALGSGTDNTVGPLAVSGTDLYVGGGFTTAGGKPSNYLGIWHIPQSATATPTPTNTPTNTPAGGNVLWVDEVNVTETPNPSSLQKVGASVSWDAGAVSAQQILTGDGSVEITVANPTANVMFGLSKGNPNQDYVSIKYALYVYTPTTSLVVYESGIYRGTFGAYAAGDRLRVGVTSGTVRYSRNGTAVYTSTVPVTAASYPLIMDTSLGTSNSRVLDASIAGASLITVPSATPTSVPAAMPVTNWQNATSVTVNANSLTKNTTTLGWDAGASSLLAIQSGDGYVQASVPDTTSRVVFGLSRGDTSRNYPEIDYGWQVYSGVLGIYENAVTRGSFGAYTPGTLLRIAVTNGVVRYYAGGVLRYTSTVPVPSGAVTGYPLLLDTSLYKGTLNGAAIGGSNVSLIAAAQGAAPGAFRDVVAGSAYNPYLVCLAAQGVVSGYADGTFRPEASLTRGQLIQVLAARWLNPAIPPVQQTFRDVQPGSAFWLAAEALANYRLLHGYKDGSLRPEAAATRGQAVVLLAAAAGLSDRIPPTRQTFRDVPAGSAQWLAVERLAAHKLVGGYADGTFRPDAALTRGQMVALVGRVLYADCQAAPVPPTSK